MNALNESHRSGLNRRPLTTGKTVSTGFESETPCAARVKCGVDTPEYAPNLKKSINQTSIATATERRFELFDQHGALVGICYAISPRQAVEAAFSRAGLQDVFARAVA
jgi:hypothetical protein